MTGIFIRQICMQTLHFHHHARHQLLHLESKQFLYRDVRSIPLLNSRSFCSTRFYRAAKSETQNKESKQTTRVLYDGECKLCTVEIAGLKWLARKKPNVEFVDITSLDYEPSEYSDVTYEKAMKEMHVVGPQGQVYTQGDAIRQMYRASGLGWLASLTEVPGVRGVCDRLYVRFAHYRLRKALGRCDSEGDRCSIKLHKLKEKMGNSV